MTTVLSVTLRSVTFEYFSDCSFFGEPKTGKKKEIMVTQNSS